MTKRREFLQMLGSGAVAGGLGGMLARRGESGNITHTHEETTYERVMRTGKIRCGYGIWPPYLDKDPLTGKLSGIFYDYMKHMEESLNLEFEMAEEMGWGTFPAALNSGRIDVFFSPAWINGSRAREVDFVSPATYNPAVIVVRKDDRRFDNNPDQLNRSKITFVQDEGGAEARLARALFPKANVREMPQLTTPAQIFMELQHNKADAVLTQAVTYYNFIKNNPDTLKTVQTKEPIQVSPESITVKADEIMLRRLLSNATKELSVTKQIGAIIKNYDLPDHAIYIPQENYIAAQ